MNPFRLFLLGLGGWYGRRAIELEAKVRRMETIHEKSRTERAEEQNTPVYLRGMALAEYVKKHGAEKATRDLYAAAGGKQELPATSRHRFDALRQLASGYVADGDLISKSDRDAFVSVGWVDRGYGFNFLTARGVEAAHALGLLKK